VRDDGSASLETPSGRPVESEPAEEAAQPPVDPFAAVREEQERGMRAHAAAVDAWRLEMSLANLAALEAARRNG